MPMRAQKLKPQAQAQARSSPPRDACNVQPKRYRTVVAGLQPSPTLQTTHPRPFDGTSDVAEVRDAQLKSAGRDPCALPSERASHNAQLNSAGRDPCALPSERASHIATCPEYHVERNRTTPLLAIRFERTHNL